MFWWLVLLYCAAQEIYQALYSAFNCFGYVNGCCKYIHQFYITRRRWDYHGIEITTMTIILEDFSKINIAKLQQNSVNTKECEWYLSYCLEISVIHADYISSNESQGKYDGSSLQWPQPTLFVGYTIYMYDRFFDCHAFLWLSVSTGCVINLSVFIWALFQLILAI